MSSCDVDDDDDDDDYGLPNRKFDVWGETFLCIWNQPCMRAKLGRFGLIFLLNSLK